MSNEQTDVVIVGAGLAGLAAALHLHNAGLDVAVLESGDGPGGRVRTDSRDGLLFDRGFQLLNPAYPETHRVLDLDALDLQPFAAGVVVHRDGRRHVLADPIRLPSAALATVRTPLGRLREKLAALRWGAEVGFGPASHIRRQPDTTLEQELAKRGIGGDIGEIVRLFLSGVLAEDELVTSRRFGEFLLRMFVRGTPSVPAQGMQAMPDQLAAKLPAGALRLGVTVTGVDAGTRNAMGVRTDAGPVTGRRVVVAADPGGAADLLGRARPSMKALTTYYHRADAPPATNRLLHVDLDRTGPIRNTGVVSTVAPAYSRDGALIASTVLGVHGAELADEVRAQAGRIYGVDPTRWELVATYPIAAALPSVRAGQPLRQPVDLGGGLFVAGDHRDTASIQGALVSGRRAATAVLASLGRP